MFKPKFAASEVDRLAKDYWPAQSDRLRNVETALINRRPYVQAAGYLTRSDLVLVGSWTAPRAKHRYEKNSEEAVRKVTGRALSTQDEHERITSLDSLEGIGYPLASTVLHFFHKDVYPILSPGVLWSLSVENVIYDFDFWLNYTQFFRQLVSAWGKSARALDRALWQFQYESTSPGEVPYSDDD